VADKLSVKKCEFSEAIWCEKLDKVIRKSKYFPLSRLDKRYSIQQELIVHESVWEFVELKKEKEERKKCRQANCNCSPKKKIVWTARRVLKSQQSKGSES
jgi:hypothetical protein